MKKRNLLLGILLIIPFFISCQSSLNCIKGAGEIVSQNYDLKNFSAISFEIPGELQLTQSAEFSIKIDAQQNILDNIKITVVDNVIYLKSEKCLMNLNENSIKIYISCPDLNSIKLRSSGDISLVDNWAFQNLALYIGGSGSIAAGKITVNGTLENEIGGSGDLQIENAIVSGAVSNKVGGSGNLYIGEISAMAIANSIQGSGDLKVENVKACKLLESKIGGSGSIFVSSIDTVTSNNLEIMGSGDINSEKVVAKLVSAKIIGSGNISVNAIQTINADILGSGNIYYKGSPVINYSDNGSGDLLNRN